MSVEFDFELPQDECWWARRSTAEDYSDDFEPLLAELYPDEHASYLDFGVRRFLGGSFLKSRIRVIGQELGRKPVMLDLMSFGGVHADLHLSGVAVGSSDQRENSEIRRDPMEMVVGDVFQEDCWQATLDWLKEDGLEHFDIVLMRPVGPVFKYTNPKMWSFVVGMGKELLNPEIGLMLMVINDSALSLIDEVEEGWQISEELTVFRNVEPDATLVGMVNG